MSPVLIATVGAIGLALVVLAAWAVVSRRAIARRLDAAATRLGGLDDDSGRRTDALMSRLERVIDAAAARDVESRAAADRLSRAFETIDLGIVVCDEDGQVVFRNDVYGRDPPTLAALNSTFRLPSFPTGQGSSTNPQP